MAEGSTERAQISGAHPSGLAWLYFFGDPVDDGGKKERLVAPARVGGGLDLGPAVGGGLGFFSARARKIRGWLALTCGLVFFSARAQEWGVTNKASN